MKFTMATAATATVLSAMAGMSMAGDGACGQAQKPTATVINASMAQKATGNIVETAVGAGKFNTLVAAVKAAGLVDTLSGPGPFTVFAPTDEAFAKLPAGTVENLLKPENKELLKAVLTYHVVPGKVMASDVGGLTSATTVNGQRLDISTKGGVKVDNAKVTATDILATNGVIHVIDTVIMPSSKNVLETAAAAGSFKTLSAAIQAAGLVSTLEGSGPFTVLAPTDEAFAKLPAGTVENLLKPENKSQLVDVLTFHVIPGRIYADQALKTKTFKTVQGGTVTFAADGTGAKVNGATIAKTDIDSSNGVIHVIDTVILPAKN